MCRRNIAANRADVKLSITLIGISSILPFILPSSKCCSWFYAHYIYKLNFISVSITSKIIILFFIKYTTIHYLCEAHNSENIIVLKLSPLLYDVIGKDSSLYY